MIKPSKALVFCALIVTALLPRTSFADGARNGVIDDSQPLASLGPK